MGDQAAGAPCPCQLRTLEDQGGKVVWRAADTGQHCGNPSQPYRTGSGDMREGGWCEDCITKVCEHCRHD